ncbi:MAG: branched-chain amino acid ABC transporter permease [Pseudomonadota bacterium]|nr:branched-chain amino acid ABC transporter permease [Pseudomonadota bacterium]
MKNLTLRSWVTLLVLGLLALVPPIVSVTDSAFFLDLATRLVILAIAAVSLNLILGYGRMISFGHAAYLGIGAYAVGIPAYYEIYSGFIQIPIAIVVSALFAFVTGVVCLRTRGVNFIMITMAFSMMVFFAFVSIEEYGGDDGLVIEVRSEFGRFLNLENATVLYYVCFVSLLAALYLIHRIVHSRFGMVIQGARGNEPRLQSLGFNTFRYKLTCYVIAGTICGYAGALLGNFTSFISPEMMDWTRSGELIFMVVLGGTGSVFGPVFGTGAYLLLEETLPNTFRALARLASDVGWLEEMLSGLWLHWQLVFGILLILVVLFAKGGIDSWLGRRQGR